MRYVYIIFIVVLLGAAAGYAWYNKPHKNVAKAKSDYTIAAPQLFQAFEADEAAANAKYLDKVVQVKGTLKSVGEEEPGTYTFTLDAGREMAGVVCSVNKDKVAKGLNYKPGQTITIKGICTGMLMDVVLVNCVVVE